VAYLAIDGIAELATAARMSGSRGRTSVAVSGVIALVLAGFLWIGFPATAAWAVGLLVGANLLVTGLDDGGRRDGRSASNGRRDPARDRASRRVIRFARSNGLMRVTLGR